MQYLVNLAPFHNELMTIEKAQKGKQTNRSFPHMGKMELEKLYSTDTGT